MVVLIERAGKYNVLPASGTLVYLTDGIAKNFRHRLTDSHRMGRPQMVEGLDIVQITQELLSLIGELKRPWTG